MIPTSSTAKEGDGSYRSESFSIEIDAPIWRVYQNWSRLDQFPAFVSFVGSANWDAHQRLQWSEEHNGKTYKWDYDVQLDAANSSLRWTSISGPENSGVLQCEPLSAGRSRLTLAVRYLPDDGIQSSRAVRNRFSEFLSAFKDHLKRES